jgi:hypothetical protein
MSGNTIYARPPFSEWIDFGDVKNWIADCDSRACEDCWPLPFSLSAIPRGGQRQIDFRLTGVTEMCLICAPWNAKYVALSYIWGRSSRKRLTLTSDNEKALTQPMAFKNEPLPPNTIRDAITVVSKIGERYLCVDSLCLLQDDDVEIQECVAIMDVFHEMAKFTIIVAGGEDAFAGLEGVPPTKRLTPAGSVKQITPGLRMTAIMDVDTLLQLSVYTTQAWTCI